MKVTELKREQLIQLKQDYLCRIADDGRYAEVMGVAYDEPSHGDMANADVLITDEVIFRHFAGYEFVESDFR